MVSGVILLTDYVNFYHQHLFIFITMAILISEARFVTNFNIDFTGLYKALREYCTPLYIYIIVILDLG